MILQLIRLFGSLVPPPPRPPPHVSINFLFHSVFPIESLPILFNCLKRPLHIPAQISLNFTIHIQRAEIQNKIIQMFNMCFYVLLYVCLQLTVGRNVCTSDMVPDL